MIDFNRLKEIERILNENCEFKNGYCRYCGLRIDSDYCDDRCREMLILDWSPNRVHSNEILNINNDKVNKEKI